MNRRLLGVVVIAAVALLAVAAGATSSPASKSTRHPDHVVVRQPGPGSPTGAGAAQQGLREVPSGREDQPGLQGLPQPRRHGAARSRVRQRARCDRGEPGLPDRRPAREGEADPAAHQVHQEVQVGPPLRSVDLGDVPLDARRQVVRQGPGLGHRADRPERRRLLQQEEAARARVQPEQDATDVRGVRQAPRPATGEAARRRAGDRTRQRGGVRLHPPLRRHPGRDTSRRRRFATGSTMRPARATTRPGRSRHWPSFSNGARRATSTTTTTRSTTTSPRRSSARARASSGSAATGTRRSSRQVSARRTSV